MRDIKFRAFYEQSQTWVYFTFSQPLTDVAKAIHQNICINGGVFYQFTGLKDKNGEEIYEGDIVKARGALVFSSPQVKKNELREIYRGDAGFTGVRVNSYFDKSNPSSIHDWSNYTLWNVSHDLEIIGNIYENPELFQ